MRRATMILDAFFGGANVTTLVDCLALKSLAQWQKIDGDIIRQRRLKCRGVHQAGQTRHKCFERQDDFFGQPVASGEMHRYLCRPDCILTPGAYQKTESIQMLQPREMCDFSCRTASRLRDLGEKRAVEVRNCVAVASKSLHTNRMDCMSCLFLTWPEIWLSSSGGNGMPMTTAIYKLKSLEKEHKTSMRQQTVLQQNLVGLLQSHFYRVRVKLAFSQKSGVKNPCNPKFCDSLDSPILLGQSEHMRGFIVICRLPKVQLQSRFSSKLDENWSTLHHPFVLPADLVGVVTSLMLMLLHHNTSSWSGFLLTVTSSLRYLSHVALYLYPALYPSVRGNVDYDLIRTENLQ